MNRSWAERKVNVWFHCFHLLFFKKNCFHR
jgi:hypothetical protein